MTGRVLFTLLAVGALSSRLTTCRSPGEQGKGSTPSAEPVAEVQLDKVDTSELSAREKQDFSRAVTELLAPCPDQPVSLAQCVKEARDCKACLPASQFVATMVRRGAPRAKIETAFRIRFAPDTVKSIDVAGLPSKGAADAPVTLVEWADFQCPFCKMAAPLIDSKLEAFPGKLRVVFRNYPLASHEQADGAARAAIAAGLQGKFWEMHRQLFLAQDLGKPALLMMAKQLGLDLKKFEESLTSEPVADALAKDRKAADALGLDGTPLIYINGRHFNLEYFSVEEDLDPWIALEIEQRTGQKVTPVVVKLPEPPSSAQAKTGPSAKPLGSAAPSAKPAGSR